MDGCEIKPATDCEAMVLNFVGGLADENLAGANFHKATLSGAYIERTVLTRVNFTEAVLDDVNILYGTAAGANFSGSGSTNIYFGSTSLRRALLNGATFGQSKFYRVDGTGADLTDAEMPGIVIAANSASIYDRDRRSTWNQANFTRAILTGAKIDDADLRGATFIDADLSRSTLRWISADRADLTQANLSFATIHEAELPGADLSLGLMVDSVITSSNLSGAEVSGLVIQDSIVRGTFLHRAQGDMRITASDMSGAPPSGEVGFHPNSAANASLRGSAFVDSDMRGVNFTGADLRNVDFTGSNIRGAIFDGADMRGVTLPDSALGARPGFGCDADTRWSGAYQDRFRSYCRGKGDRVKPGWCSAYYEKTPALCALCGRICVEGRSSGATPIDVPTPCDLRAIRP